MLHYSSIIVRWKNGLFCIWNWSVDLRTVMSVYIWVGILWCRKLMTKQFWTKQQMTSKLIAAVLTNNEFQSHLRWRGISDGYVHVSVCHGKNTALFEGCF
jgi:hypothetical protein